MIALNRVADMVSALIGRMISPDTMLGFILRLHLWERLKKYETSVLLFAKLPHVSFTNNRAERDLRMAKVKQKVSGCFRTEKYARAYGRISSYLQTMKNKDINPVVAISMALSGKIEL